MGQRDRDISIQIRKNLREKFPNTVFLVTVVDGEYDVSVLSGQVIFPDKTTRDLEEEMEDCIMKAFNIGEQ
jgi:hypothetical protein